MFLSIIIINYNLSDETKNCINSLLNLIIDFEFEIILVDNHSEDKSIENIAGEFLRNNKLKFKFFQSEKNIGFGNACNLAVKSSSGEWLLFLNPDTLIIENVFNKVLNEFRDNFIGKGILGLNVNSNKFMDYSAGPFPNFFFEFLNVFLLGRYCEALYVKFKSIISRSKRIKAGWVMGAALFISRKLFMEVNGFDPDYFLYFEEMDLCKRVTNKNLPVTYLADIKIEHLGSSSSKKNYYFFTKMFYKGKLLFIKKHSSPSMFNIYKVLFLLTIINQTIFWWLFKFSNKEKSMGKIRGFGEIIKNLSSPEKI